VSDGVEVGGDELAAGVFSDTEGGHLDLVVVDVSIKSNDDSGHVVIMFKKHARSEFYSFIGIFWAADVFDSFEVQFFLDAYFSYYVDFLVFGEVGGFQVGCSCIGGGIDLLCVDLQA